MAVNRKDFFDATFLADFIEQYREFTCLWKIKDRDYKNEDVKNTAWNVLVKLCREHVTPAASIGYVKGKIRMIRNGFREELGKIKESKRARVDPEDIYKPKCWYFELLMFLADQSVSRRPMLRLNDSKRAGAERRIETSSVDFKKEFHDSLSGSRFNRCINPNIMQTKDAKKSIYGTVQCNKSVLVTTNNRHQRITSSNKLLTSTHTSRQKKPYQKFEMAKHMNEGLQVADIELERGSLLKTPNEPGNSNASLEIPEIAIHCSISIIPVSQYFCCCQNTENIDYY